jgi:hypothetical protein
MLEVKTCFRLVYIRGRLKVISGSVNGLPVQLHPTKVVLALQMCSLKRLGVIQNPEIDLLHLAIYAVIIVL